MSRRFSEDENPDQHKNILSYFLFTKEDYYVALQQCVIDVGSELADRGDLERISLILNSFSKLFQEARSKRITFLDTECNQLKLSLRTLVEIYPGNQQIKTAADRAIAVMEGAEEWAESSQRRGRRTASRVVVEELKISALHLEGKEDPDQYFAEVFQLILDRSYPVACEAVENPAVILSLEQWRDLLGALQNDIGEQGGEKALVENARDCYVRLEIALQNCINQQASVSGPDWDSDVEEYEPLEGLDLEPEEENTSEESKNLCEELVALMEKHDYSAASEQLENSTATLSSKQILYLQDMLSIAVESEGGVDALRKNSEQYEKYVSLANSLYKRLQVVAINVLQELENLGVRRPHPQRTYGATSTTSTSTTSRTSIYFSTTSGTIGPTPSFFRVRRPTLTTSTTSSTTSSTSTTSTTEAQDTGEDEGKQAPSNS